MKKISMKKNILLTIFCGGAFLCSAPAYSSDWSYQIEPYLMVSNIKGDASIGRATGLPVDVGFGDIVENLDLGGMVHFEAHNTNGWGVSLDYGFMKLGSEFTGERGGVTNVNVRQGVLEGLLMRSNVTRDTTVDYFIGFRWWDNDLDLTVNPGVLPGEASTGVKEDWVDLIIGARWTKSINEKWKLQLRGDIGGLGLSSDFTATVTAGAQYKISDSMALDLQYKVNWVDYKNGAPRGEPGYFAYDTNVHGPVFGLIFNF